MKNAAGVILGYLTMFAVVMVSFSVLYQVLGADGAFQEGSFAVSSTWAVSSLVLSLVAALVGGWVCAKIAGTRAAVTSLAALVLVLGVLFAIPSFGVDPAEAARAGDVDGIQAMQNAITPLWIAILTPLIGAVGVMLGGRVGPGEDEVLRL